MSGSNDIEIARHFQQNEIAISAFEAAQKPFTESILRNPDAALALDLQRLEVNTPKPSPNEHNNERITRPLQGQEHFERGGHRIQRLTDNDVTNRRQQDGARVDRLNEALQSMERSGPRAANTMNFSMSVRGPSMVGNPNLTFFGPANVTNHFPEINERPSRVNDSDSILPAPRPRPRHPRMGQYLNQDQRHSDQRGQGTNDNRGPFTGQTGLQHLQRRGIGNPERQTVERQEPESIGQDFRNPIAVQPRRHPGMPRLGGINRHNDFQNDIETDSHENGYQNPRHDRRLPGMPRFGGINHHHGANNFEVDTDDYEALWELQERNGDVMKKGLSKHQIGRIPHYRYKKTPGASRNDKDWCRICLSDYNNGENVKPLPCLHSYHKSCIDRWLQSQAVCPVCRENIRIN